MNFRMSLRTRAILTLGFSVFFVVGLGVTVSAQQSCNAFSGSTSYAPAIQDQPSDYYYLTANTNTINAGQSVVLTYQALTEYDSCEFITNNVDSTKIETDAGSLKYYCANQTGRSGCANWGIDMFSYSGSVSTPALYQTTQYCYGGEGNPPCTTITVNPVACTSGANTCGQTNSGYIQQGGSCSASTPANPGYYGTSCSATSAGNSCGQTNTNYGSYNCSDQCTASTPSPPANPGYYGTSCSATSGANACGQTATNYGSYNCSDQCTASQPSPPANPSYYGQSCTSSPNVCGQTNSGTYNCSDVCSASTPSNNGCTPSVPTFAYLYDDANGSYIGTAGSAYHSAGYRIYISGTSPDGSNVALYYQLYSVQTGSVIQAGWATPTWNGSGGWAYVDGLANAAPGTYYVEAYTYDADGVSSSWSGWQTITLSTPALSASCSVSPTTTSVGGSVTWAAAASGGSGTGYTYSWSGTNLNSKTGQSVQVSYASGGTYPGAVTVTDSVGDSSGSVSCTTNGGGHSGGGASVYVTPVPAATLSASPSTVNSGHASSLTWSSTNATSCTSAGGFSTGGATSNAVGVSTGTLTSSQSYQIYCDGPSGRGYSNIVPVTVISPAAYITAAPLLISSGESTQVSWSASNVDSCSVSGTDGYSSGTLTGPTIATTTVSRTLTNPATYTMTCPTQSISTSVTVDIAPGFQEF